MGAPAPRDDRRSRGVHRRRAREALLRRLEQPRVFSQQQRPPVPPQLAPAAVRRVHPRRGLSVHLRLVPDRDHPDCHDGRLARGLSRRKHALPLPPPRQALLRAVRRVRPEAVHERDVRRQLLLPQSRGLHGESRRPLDQGATRELRDSAGNGLWTVGRKPVLVHDVGHPGAEGRPPLSGRLGPAGRS